MKIKIDPYNDDAYRPFLTILSAKGGTRENEAFNKLLATREEATKAGKDCDEYDIVLTINGIEFDYTDFTQAYIRQMDELIRQRAGNLIDEKVSHLSNDLEYIRGLLEQAGSEAKRKLGITDGERW